MTYLQAVVLRAGSKLKENFSGWTLVGTTIALISLVPDWQARIRFWVVAVHWLIPRLATPWGRVILLGCGLVLMWLDHRRVLKKRQQNYDPSSLKGRTLKLRDEIQQFLNAVGPMVLDHAGPEDLTKDIETVVAHSDRLTHGYDLKFASDVRRIFHEFGERGIHDPELEVVIDRPKTEDRYRTVIASLTRLAGKTE